MDNSITETIEQLFEKAEAYGKTTIKLGKHLALYGSADVISDLAVKLVIFSVVASSILFANIGLSLYLGEVLGKQYLGFLAVGVFYLIVAVLAYIFKNACIKNPVSKYVIGIANKDVLL